MPVVAAKTDAPATTGHTARAGRGRTSGKGLLGLGFLLPTLIVSFLSWIILIGGLAAVTDKARNRDEDAKTSLVSMSWVIVVYFLLMLLLIIGLGFMDMKSGPRGYMRRASTPLLFFLAILIAWMGIETDKALAHDRANTLNIGHSRLRTWAAGLIMCLIEAFILALFILASDFMDHRHGAHVVSPSTVQEGKADPEAAGAAGGQIAYPAGDPARPVGTGVGTGPGHATTLGTGPEHATPLGTGPHAHGPHLGHHVGAPAEPGLEPVPYGRSTPDAGRPAIV